ncbi:MAG: hypothetical protein LBR81_06455 [Prevotellaceae bacterium]|jgi:hypothetical protein|nr:hypothetical protein [Prevotellaceae bacterium]
MAKRNRQTLKESFRQGKKPSEEDFENLIDSTMNILDDGFSKNPETGIALAPMLDKGTVLSVFMEMSDTKPQWEIAITPERSLEIRSCCSEQSVPMLTLGSDGSVRIGEKGKTTQLSGTLQMPVREGSLYSGLVPANGRWQDITPDLDGCQALEIVAAASKRQTGKHAVLVATATVCFGKRTKIQRIRSHFGFFGHKICIRWKKNGTRARLQIKTLLNYGEEIPVRYHVTGLLRGELRIES